MLAVLLAVLAISQRTISFEAPIDLLFVLAIAGAAAAVGRKLSVVLPDETSAGEGAK
jgi:NADH:ubiquinone oxidoreductase subunit K